MGHQDIIIITGSSGYIGSAIAKSLSAKYKIIGLDRSVPQNKIPGVEYREVDFSASEKIGQTLKEVKAQFGPKILSVVHLIAYYSFSGEESSKYEEITVEGSRSLVEGLNQNFEARQFIFSSTMLVHAPAPLGGKIKESSPLQPGWAYPESKVWAEKAIRESNHKMKTVNLRIAGVYDDHCHSIPLAQNIVRIYEKQFSSFLFPGNVDHAQSYIHLEDLVSAISRMIEVNDGLPEEATLILGEEAALSFKELQEEIGEHLHNHPWPLIQVPSFIAKTGAYLIQKAPFTRDPFIKPWMIEYADENYVLDISKLKQLIEWKPKHNLRTALPLMLKELKDDPVTWYKDHKIEPPPARKLPIDFSEEHTFRVTAFINMFLGLWLMASPFTIGNVSTTEFWLDLILGFFITLNSAITLIPTMRWLRWLNCGFAATLMFSPLIFWTESAAVYLNDTIISSIVLLASAYSPKQFSFSKSKETPEGWSYNPSTWMQRLPIMFLAFIGFLIARYLSSYQLGHIETVWDPFFGDGTARTLTSDISKAFPVSDAGLGALSYLLDLISASIGDRNRYRTMPWMVILFGLLIIPSGVVSITLIILQPVGVGAWCTLCLFTAVIMLMMVPPAIDEVVASVQYMRQSSKKGYSVFEVFWSGGPEFKSSKVVSTDPMKFPFPFHLLASCLISAWMLFTPALFDIQGIAATNIYITGSLLVTFSFIAMSEVARITRLVNLPLGLWLTISAFMYGDLSGLAIANSVTIGLVIFVLNIFPGNISQHFGRFDKWSRWDLKELFQ